jgi:alpha-1,3-rhamnosyl/mannosyltransferase
MMRLALNATSLLSPLTGIGQYTWHLTRGLLASPEVETDLFYGTHWSAEMRESALPGVDSIKTMVNRLMPNAAAFSRFVRQRRFNDGMRRNGAVVYHEPNFLAFRADVPTVVTVHDLSWIRYPGAHPAARVNMMNKFFAGSLDRASLVLTDSAFVKRELIELFNVPADRIRTVLLGVDAMFHPQEAAATAPLLARYGLSHGQYMLAVGTLEPRKNLVAALNAFSLLPAALRRSYPLVVVGMSGWHTADIEARMAPLIAAGELRQLGFVSRDELALIVAGATTLVYPSLYEGFGLPPLEAMACGVPVIVSDVSSLPEVVGDTGILVQPHDVDAIAAAMRSMVEDPGRRAALGALARSRSAGFTWERCVAQTIDAYRSVVA